MSNQNINSLETVYVLNDKYQFESNNVTSNAKWLDTSNVVSVKRDKTIYAIRAKNDLNFNSNTNQEFFATNVSGRSDLYRNFGSNVNQSILMTNPAPVYGNITAGQVGISGSLVNGFQHTNRASGNINVSSNVFLRANGLSVSELPLNLQKTFNGNVTQNSGFGNVDNNTCNKVLRLNSNVAAPVWNRLINANINGNVLVNCSTDPCDLNGAAIPSSPFTSSGNAITNEVYREQVAVKLNPSISPADLSINNPVYIASVSPFGSNLSGTVGIAENISLHSFTGNFFANLPSDNTLYANGNLLTGVSISGNINPLSLSLFNSNVLVENAVLNGINLINDDDTNTALNNIVDVKINNDTLLDTLHNSGLIIDGSSNIDSAGTFQMEDDIMIVQGNISISPLYLMDRLSPSNSTGFVVASNIFSNSNLDTRSNITANINSPGEDLSYYCIAANLQTTANIVEKNAKYLYLTGDNIQSDNWQIVSNVVQPVAVPSPTGIPNQTLYVSGNIIDVYVQKGSIGVSNYTPHANKQNSGVWVKSIPSFMNTFNEPTGNAYLNANVFGNVGVETKNINIGNLSAPINITANLVDNYNFYFFGNTTADARTNKRVGNVVANVNSVMANVWNYDANGNTIANATTKWSPVVVYGNVSPSSNPSIVRPLSISSDFAKGNVDYKLEFPYYVGKTDAPSTGDYTFFANISANGSVLGSNVSSLSHFNLNNNSAVNDILLNDVVSTTFTIKTNSYKYTDIGNIIAQNSGNVEFNSVLPFSGNANVSVSPSNTGFNIGDVAMNVIVDYFQNPVLLSGQVDNVHRLTIYDIQYRYAITNVIRSGASPLGTKITINGSADVAQNLVTTNGNIAASVINGNVAAPEFTLFMYDSVSQYSSNDTLYPFSNSTLNSDGEHRFPGFNYRNGEWYSSKTDTEVDFTIESNTSVEQNVNFLFQTINAGGNTISVAKSTDNAFKSIPIRKIRLGYSNGINPYYGYIVVKVLGEASSYVVILYKLHTTGNDYDSKIKESLPVMVNVKSIELSSNSKQQVEFKSALRVYDVSNNLVQSFTNTINSHKSPLSLFNYSTLYGSNDSSIAVNTYSAPPSNSIMQWAYKQNVIRQLVEYEYVNKALNGMSGYTDIPSQTSSTKLFAMTELNVDTSPKVDPNNALLTKIPGLSKRCYLDAGYGNGVYIDISNTYVIVDPIQFTVGRSVEWVLKRKLDNQSTNSYQVVGRGLLTHARNETTPYSPRDYLILENDLTKETSGFQMTVNTNIVDLSSRLLAQSSQPNGTLKNGPLNELALNIRSVPDQLAMVIYKINPVDDVEGSSPFGGPYPCSASSASIDLAELKTSNTAYRGQLPSFNLSAIRGYQYGEISNRTNALFSINYTRDNYAIIQLVQNANKTITTAGRLENAGSITFSSNNVSQFELYCSSLDINFKNVLGEGTLNRNFASLVGKSDDFFKYASYKHVGFGSISYSINEFNSNYGKSLPTQEIKSGSQTPVFNFSSNAAYNVPTQIPTPLVTPIKYSNTWSKYYIEIQNEQLYFRGTGLNSLPSNFSGSNTVLLYTGTRPIVVSTLTMAPNSNLAHMRDNVAHVVQANMFKTRNWLTYTSSYIEKHLYGVFFTNSLQTGSATVRSLIVKPQPAYLQSNRKFYLGAFINSSSLMTNTFVNVSYSNGSYRYPFFITGNPDIVNPVQSVDKVTSASGADKTLCSTLKCRNGTSATEIGVLGDLFNLTIINKLATTSFSVNINPATLSIYQAIDTDFDGELDVNSATTTPNALFGLDAAFSELLYTLTPVSATSKLNVPKVIDSWPLNREYRNIKGSSLDINMNVKWNVGYNLGNFFTFRQNNVAEFDVITVHTEYNSSANDKNMTNLVVSPVSKLIIGNKHNWAHASPDNTGPLSGLAFKLNSANNVRDGDIVRLFVDNQIPTNNTLSINVGTKSYKLSSYDQERYAALLDEQIRFTNKIE